MANPLLIAARIVPYGGGRAQAPIAVNDTGLILSSGSTGQTVDFDILANDQRLGTNPTVTLLTRTGPIGTTPPAMVNGRLRIKADDNVASNTAFSQQYRVDNGFGIAEAVASGTVQAAAATASIVYQWELHDGFLNAQIPATGGIRGTQTGLVAFGQGPIPTGASDGGVAMRGQQGFLSFDDPGVQNAQSIFQQQAFGISLYVQVGALAATGAAPTTAFSDGSNWSDGSAWTDSGTSSAALQLVHKDNGGIKPPGGLAIEYANVGGINRLDPYMRDADGTVLRFNPPSPATARDIAIDQSFLVTFTYEPTPAAGGKCKLYLRKQGGATALVGDGLTDESAVTTGLLQNFETWVLGTYTQTAGGMHGALQRLIFWAGAPTLTQLNTLLSAPANNITITYPPIAGLPVITTNPLTVILDNTETTRTINPAALASNATSATVTITGKTGNYDATVSSQDGQTVVVARIGTAATTGSIQYTLTNSGGLSASGSIDVTVEVVLLPIAANITGRNLIENQVLSFAIDVGHQNVDNGLYAKVGNPTGPIDSTTVSGASLVVDAGTHGTGSPVAWAQNLSVTTTPGGTANFSIAGLVNPLVVSTATIIGQWELDTVAGIDSVGVPPNPAVLVNPYYGLGSIVSGATGGAMGCNREPYALVPHIPAYATQAGGVSIYCQVSSMPTNPGENRQIVVKDSAGTAGGWTIEQRNVGGVSRLGGYIRNDAATAVWFDGASAGAAGVANLPLNTAFMVTLTFDPAATPKCRMYLQLGGAVNVSGTAPVLEVASIVDNGLTALASNTQGIRVAIYATAQATTLDGAVQRLIVWSGAPSLAQLESALANPRTITITPPAANPPVAADYSVTLLSTADSLVTNPATQSTNAAGATVSFTETVTNATVSQSGQNLTILRTGTAAGTGPINYTLTNPDLLTDTGVISVTVQARAVLNYTPVTFRTDPFFSVNHTGVENRPGFNASNPLLAAVTDPMSGSGSGIKIIRIGGNRGASVLTWAEWNGSNSVDTGLKFPQLLVPENLGSFMKVWNADSSLAIIERTNSGDDPPPKCSSYIVDATGQYNTANVKWRIIRAHGSVGMETGTNWWFWDPTNPLRAIVPRGNGAVDEWWPIGNPPGTNVGRIVNLHGAIPNYKNFTNHANRQPNCSHDGKYYVFGCQRNSDNYWGGIRIDLTTGNRGPFAPVTMCLGQMKSYTDDFNANGVSAWTGNNKRNPTSISPFGGYAFFLSNDEMVIANMITGTFHSYTGSAPLVNTGRTWGHPCWAVVNGKEYMIGNTPSGIRMYDVVAKTERFVCTMNAANTGHMSCLNYHDKFETYGAAGGSSSGQRYAFFSLQSGQGSRPAGLWACRLGNADNGLNAIRYICHHRSERLKATLREPHPTISPNGRYFAWNSNWFIDGTNPQGLSDDTHAYVALLPDAWYSPNNNGS